jgi:hypothetical protein
MSRIRSLIKPTFVAFFTLVPVLLLTALIKVPCPACGGGGQVNGTPGMENVRVLDLKYAEAERVQDACGVYTVWRYSIKLQLLNEGNEEAVGWIKVDMIDTTQAEGSNIVDTQYIKVDVPVQAILSSDFNVVFGTGLDQPGWIVLRAEALRGKVPCVACAGKGKIALNALPFVSSLSSYLREVSRSEGAYHPPVNVDWSDYVFYNE